MNLSLMVLGCTIGPNILLMDEQSQKIWNEQYGEKGGEHINEICKHAYALKTLCDEIGWGVMNINTPEIKILIDFSPIDAEHDEDDFEQ